MTLLIPDKLLLYLFAALETSNDGNRDVNHNRFPNVIFCFSFFAENFKMSSSEDERW